MKYDTKFVILGHSSFVLFNFLSSVAGDSEVLL